MRTVGSRSERSILSSIEGRIDCRFARGAPGPPVADQSSVSAPTPEVLRDVALTRAEYERAFDELDRPPNTLELGIIGGLWSEHCGYKHSRPLLKRLPGKGARVLFGPGEENAGAVDIGDGLAVVMKIESHNHPSAVEPFQGAATGVGGILRDIFTMGARPVAILDSLRFGPLESARGRYLANGVISGIAWYGNCVGVPTVGGEIGVAPCYAGNPLVNALCVGVARHENLTRAVASGTGNQLVLVGADTGRDGIHGATFASVEDPEASHRGVVQVGNPFMEKLLLEACLEVLGGGAVVGLQDLGATGLSSASVEAAARSGTGVRLHLEQVARRADSMTPYEVMLSESQERMLVTVERGRASEVQAVFAKWGLHSDVVGEVTDGGELEVCENGAPQAELPIRMLVDAPTYTYPIKRPAYLDEVQALDPTRVPEPTDLTHAFSKLLESPNIASRRGVFRQYDHMVGINTIAPPGGDAAVLRVKGTRKGLALATDGNARLCYLDPRAGGALAVAEATRNVSCTGAAPIAITNCLNFGSPEDPAVYFQLAEVVEGMAAACRVLDVPVISGNVSLYNETGGSAIWPTPVIGALGLLEDVELQCNIGFQQAGDVVALLGRTEPDLSGSEYLAASHGLVAGKPRVDLELEKRLQGLVRYLIRDGLLQSVHDCAEGGLAVTVAECAFAGGLGADVQPDLADARPDAALFAETPSRVVVSLTRGNWDQVRRRAAGVGVPCNEIGVVGGNRLRIGPVALPSQEARSAWESGLTKALAGTASGG